MFTLISEIFRALPHLRELRTPISIHVFRGFFLFTPKLFIKPDFQHRKKKIVICSNEANYYSKTRKTSLIIFLNIEKWMIVIFLCSNVSTATPSTSGDSVKWYYIVGPILAFIVCAVVIGCYICRRRQRGESWQVVTTWQILKEVEKNIVILSINNFLRSNAEENDWFARQWQITIFCDNQVE